MDRKSRPARFGIFKVVALLALFGLVLAACGDTGSTDTPDTSSGDSQPSHTVRIGEQDFDSIVITNKIAEYIISEGYGREVTTTKVTTAIHRQALVQDELDLWLELYPQNIREWWEEVLEDGSVVNLGEVIETSRRGFYVPRYVVEGDSERGIEASAPDLVHLTDLEKYPHVFSDPEDPSKGQLVSCIIEWDCSKAIRVKWDAYGLDETFNLLEAGSNAAMDAAIVGAYKQGNPVVFYYWEPTWLVSELDLIKLEQEPFTPECEAATNAAANEEAPVTDEAKCAFPEPAIYKAASDDFVERDPEVTEFLENYFIGIDTMGDLTAWVNANEEEPELAALHFLVNYKDAWEEWVPADIAERVNAALEEDKDQLPS